MHKNRANNTEVGLDEGTGSNLSITCTMARHVKCCRSWRSKLLLSGRSSNDTRSLLFSLRRSSHSFAEVTRTATISPDRDHTSASPVNTGGGLSFNDGKNAFRSKTTWEIIRALAIFRLCTFDILVNRNKEVSFDLFHYLVFLK